MGDPAGIGGEILLKALPHIGRRSIPVAIGDRFVIDELIRLFPEYRPKKPLGKLHEGTAGWVEFVDLGLVDTVRFGEIDAVYGRAAYGYIMEALKLVLLGEVSALVTCPISKTAIHEAGIGFPGHTELLAHYGGVTDYVMMMANRRMRVSLVTIHIPLKDVAMSISSEGVYRTISITHEALASYFGVRNPRIHVCGLNPHAGEGGLMGDEETLIKEAIRSAQDTGMNALGPFPADTVFHRVDCDAFIAMYHDQGLIPVKTTDFGRTVNITLGLPFIRTSPGHGTGFDKAGRGIADPTGLIEAYRMAEKIC